MSEQTYFYYYRDRESKPRITVCLLKANGAVARGIAICSLKDNPCKKTGRKIALQRATHAMKTMHNNCEINTENAQAVFNSTMTSEFLFDYLKSSFCPPLTPNEHRIIYGE